MTDANNNGVPDQVERSALKTAMVVAPIVAVLAGGTTIAAKYDELVKALAKDKIEAAYQKGQKDQLHSTLVQTALLSACHTAAICFVQVARNGGDPEECANIREEEEERALAILKEALPE